MPAPVRSLTVWMNGLDEIGLTLQHRKDIEGYEERRRREAPWLFGARG